MESIQIEKGLQTPKVIFDPEDLQLTIRGESLPENAKKFYSPIIEAIEGFIAQKPTTSVPMNVEVKLKSINSASHCHLAEIFKLISQLHKKGLRVIIDWYIDEEDDIMRETGQEFSEISGLPFNFIEE